MDQQLSKQQEETERLKKELEQFAYIASHDLQEPLRKIIAFGDRLAKNTETFSTDQRMYLDRMLHATGRMQLMLNGLLDYSRASRLREEFVPTDLNDLLKKSIRELDPEIRRLNADIQADPLPIADVMPVQIFQLFRNLLSNALKFTEKDTAPVIKISSRIPEPQELETAGLQVGRDYAVVEFRDNGVGFEPENSAKIFLPFQRLRGRSEYEGAGMGLAVGKAIILNHSGVIRAEAAPGEGALFSVFLPVKQE